MNIKLLVIFSVVFLLLDIIWLQYFTTIINPTIEKIQRAPIVFNIPAAVVAYLIMIIAYYNIAYDNDTPNYWRSILLGLAIYGTYEFTNLATFKDWDLTTAIIDISWGVTISALSLFITDYIYRKN